ncbi:DUF3395 domain-containing protein [Massilia norwichensis]|jgi:hypothetical protein|uniref:DUF3395 domain-containing protein n=1 Tax=Massilia norwichensis TaxID=1442366 RepID=A0ABT2A1K0_9BURK|nr:DUF3395 domain-containing protein [Massilia norwichensis]MCS0588065.1 DUF3395 domain-containing protein [Massilia norwichensis]
MKNVHRHIMRLATVLALTATSNAAFAQSAEYRRGYDEGYAAGQRDARGDRGGPDGPMAWGRVHIEEAEYGARGATCNARRGVRDQLERNRGNIEVNNQLCGDPAPGEQKRLRLVYRCGDSASARVVAREGERLRLNCRR